MTKLGRPVQPVSDTEETDRLARFLRRLTEGLTLRQLEEHFPAARKSLWGEYRRGAKDVPLELLTQVIKARVPAPLQERRLQEAKVLCQQAASARAGRGRLVPTPARSAEAEAVHAYKELATAREGQLKAEQALRRSNDLVHVLLMLVGSLRSRVEELTIERDALAQQQPESRHLEQVRAERDKVQNQLLRYQEELDRARRERDQAEYLRMVAQQRAEEYQRRLEQYEQRAAENRPEDAVHEEAQVPPLPPEVSLEEYEITLERISDDLDANAQELNLLRQQLGDTGLAETDQRVVRGEVVDNADNASPSQKGQTGHASQSSGLPRPADSSSPSGEAAGGRRLTRKKTQDPRVVTRLLWKKPPVPLPELAGARQVRRRPLPRGFSASGTLQVRRIAVRVAALILGVVACLAGAHPAIGVYQERVQYEKAQPCAPGTQPSAEHACIGQETGHVVDKTAGSEGSSPSLTVARASGRTEEHAVSNQLYKTARRGSKATFKVWRGDLYEITVGGKSTQVSPASSVVPLIWSSILIAFGVSLLLSAVLGSGRIRWLFSGDKIFVSVFLGFFTYIALGFATASTSRLTWIVTLALWLGIVAFCSGWFKKEWEW